MSQQRRTVELSLALYPPAALAHAREAFNTLCVVTEQLTSRSTIVTIAPTDGAPTETVDEFLSYALSAAIELHLAEVAG